MKTKKILWLITARSGSKSVVDKNIKLLGGYPLIAYKIKSALKTDLSKEVWVSTDSGHYADISEQYGAKVPFMRPDFLSTDNASSSDVVLHAVEFAEQNNYKFEYIGLLEPTSPFVDTEDLEKALAKLESTFDASCVVAVKESRPNRIFIQNENLYLSEFFENIKKANDLGRQNFDKEITPSGGFYISRWDDFKKNKSFYTEKTMAYEVDDVSGLEIDEPFDWLFAEFIVEKSIFDKIKIFE